MALPIILIVFPIAVAVMLLAVRNEDVRKVVVYASAVLIAAASEFAAASVVADYACLGIGIAIAAVVLKYAVQYRNFAAAALAVVQVVGSVAFDLGVAHGVHVANGLYIDQLSVVMALVIGVIGSAICVYALGYMADFQAHEPESAADRRPTFFALMFLFLGAMYVIVFADNMSWMLTGWEVTTVCSFLLIGYTRTDEAIRNAFRQIIMNLLGGIAFLAALYASALQMGTLSLSEFIAAGVAAPQVVAFAVCALGFAGMTKAAQMPFHTWLLGAMVAPTPTSALLHSSTMVKAGVFLLVKLAPIFAVCALPQLMVTLGGGITFLLCSGLAISQSNAKRVLAYSTIANLGLIILCAGIGTAEAVWAAIFLIIFHAAAKSLLFLCVGTAEHHIGSRNIEDMDLLFQRMPRLARYMMLGIMVMFVAPFGMLISKWAAIVALVDSRNMLLIIMLAFGSAATFAFWAKWMGKLSGIAGNPENVEETVHPSEWIVTTLMVILAVAACMLLPVISEFAVEPYLAASFGAALQTLSDANLFIAAACTVVVVVVLFAGVGSGSGKYRKVDVYLSGVSVDDDARLYRDAMSAPREATARNFYLEGIFGEKRLSPAGSVLNAAIMVAALVATAAPFVLVL